MCNTNRLYHITKDLSSHQQCVLIYTYTYKYMAISIAVARCVTEETEETDAMEMGTAVTTRQLSVGVGTHKVVVVARSQTLALRGRS